jgi:hypothetical protein
MDAGERASAIDRFNDPKSDLDALLTSTKASTFGLNLQHNCSDLIIMCVAENVNTVVQIIGRIHRIKQVRIQRVWIITQARSWDNVLQHDQTNKMISQLAGEAKVYVPDNDDNDGSESDLDFRNDKMKGGTIRSQCEGMIMRLLGQKSSRADEMWGDRSDLEAPWKVEAEQMENRVEIEKEKQPGTNGEQPGAQDVVPPGTEDAVPPLPDHGSALSGPPAKEPPKSPSPKPDTRKGKKSQGRKQPAQPTPTRRSTRLSTKAAVAGPSNS